MKKMVQVLLMVMMTFQSHSQNSNADTNYISRISSVKWMPDGKDILLGIVKHHKRDQKAPFFSKVYLYNVQSGKLKFLFNDGSNLAPSPDGKKIAFFKRNGKKIDFFFYDLGTGKETTMKTDTMEKYGLQWSPDGENLLYNILNRGEKKPVDIFVLNLKTRQTRQVTTSGIDKSYDPVWAPDGKRIVYYFEKGDSRDQIWLTDINGSFHKNLTNDTTTHNYYPSWMDDHTIIYTQSPTSLMIMNDDGSNRKKIDGIEATPVKFSAKANMMAYIKSEEEKILVLYDWKNKTSKEVLEGVSLMYLF